MKTIFAAAALMPFFFTAANSLEMVEEKNYQIGVMYNLTGDLSDLDTPSLRGVQLGMKRMAEHDFSKIKNVELLVKNGASDLNLIKQQMQELSIMPSIIGFIGFNDNDMLLAAAPVAVKNKKLFLSSGATSPLIPTQYPDYVFLVAFGDNAQAAAGAQFAYQKLNLKNACILYDQESEYARLLMKYFREAFSKFGGSVGLQESFCRTHFNLDSQIKKIQNLSPAPDLIYVACEPAQVPLIVNKIRSSDMQQPIFGGDSFDTKDLSLIDKSIQSIYFTTHVFLDAESKDPLIRNFVASYKKAYPEEYPNAFAALGFDAFNLFAAALERAGSYKTEDILKALGNTKNFKGVTGHISYTNGSHTPIKPVTIVGFKNGKCFEAARFLPSNVPAP